MLKKYAFFILLCLCAVSPVHGGGDDNLFTRLSRVFLRAQETAKQNTPEARWKSFLARQEHSLSYLQLRQGRVLLTLQRLKATRDLTVLVPMTLRDRELLRIYHGHAPVSGLLEPGEQQNLWNAARAVRLKMEQKLVERYLRLQTCISTHTQLKSYALNPETEILFSRLRYPADRGTLTAYETLENLFCADARSYQASIQYAQVVGEGTPFAVEFRSKNPAQAVLTIKFLEKEHIIAATLAGPKH